MLGSHIGPSSWSSEELGHLSFVIKPSLAYESEMRQESLATSYQIRTAQDSPDDVSGVCCR
jgi:hypothetical protein